MTKKILIHRSETRESVSFSFMKAFHSFRPHLSKDRQQFGALVAIDEGIVSPGSKGFGFHPHKNLEVITYLARGELLHLDQSKTENNATLKARGCQLITSGTGIVHNEKNVSKTETFHGLQIWVLPREAGLEPRYGNMEFSPSDYTDQLRLFISPDGRKNTLEIQQDAFLSHGVFNNEKTISYENYLPTNGVYLYVIKGQVNIEGNSLSNGDAIGITQSTQTEINIKSGTELILCEVPV